MCKFGVVLCLLAVCTPTAFGYAKSTTLLGAIVQSVDDTATQLGLVAPTVPLSGAPEHEVDTTPSTSDLNRQINVNVDQVSVENEAVIKKQFEKLKQMQIPEVAEMASSGVPLPTVTEPSPPHAPNFADFVDWVHEKETKMKTSTRPWLEDKILKYSDTMEKIEKLPDPGEGQYTVHDTIAALKDVTTNGLGKVWAALDTPQPITEERRREFEATLASPFFPPKPPNIPTFQPPPRERQPFGIAALGGLPIWEFPDPSKLVASERDHGQVPPFSPPPPSYAPVQLSPKFAQDKRMLSVPMPAVVPQQMQLPKLPQMQPLEPVQWNIPPLTNAVETNSELSQNSGEVPFGFSEVRSHFNAQPLSQPPLPIPAAVTDFFSNLKLDEKAQTLKNSVAETADQITATVPPPDTISEHFRVASDKLNSALKHAGDQIGDILSDQFHTTKQNALEALTSAAQPILQTMWTQIPLLKQQPLPQPFSSSFPSPVSAKSANVSKQKSFATLKGLKPIPEKKPIASEAKATYGRIAGAEFAINQRFGDSQVGANVAFPKT